MKRTQVFSRILLSAVVSLCLLATLSAAIGDNPPPIPGSYNTGHPRLPVPGTAWLTSLANNPTALARYNAAADAWDSTNPGNIMFARRLLIAYMANKITNPTKAAGYLTKIKALAGLGGFWGKLLLTVNDGVGTGTQTYTSATANFLTGCGGASCVGYTFTILAKNSTVISVPNAHTVVLNTNQPPVTGTNLQIRIFGTQGDSSTVALIYDWLYNDLDAATRTELLNELDSLCTLWEGNYIGLGASPYNDVGYIRLSGNALTLALAMYPDHPHGLAHMNFMTDVWFNRLFPVWKQVFGPEGGGWHESWPDYQTSPSGGGVATYIVPSLLSWQSATGDPIFTRESWLKNYAYQTMYMTKPDFTLENFGDMSRPYLTDEYSLGIGAGLGSLSGLAEIYNDPILRGWARIVNQEVVAGPDGFEPSAWPFYIPDKNSNASIGRIGLPTTRNFSGWGTVFMRSGWTEDDTTVSLRYGDNFWSHEHFDAGAFTIFNRGNLALDTGTYRAGSASKHQNQYGRQTIAHNTLTITDPADVYSTTFGTVDENGATIQMAPPNDGGQRRLGSGYNQHFAQLDSPDHIGDWLAEWDYNHTGKMVAFATTSAYTYTAVDITAAYNNKFSASTPNATNRTNRVAKAVRHMIFVGRGKAAYVVVFDQVTSTNATFVKRWLLHTVNQPVVNGSAFTVTRSELVTELPFNWTKGYARQLKYCPSSDCTSGNQYQYAGKLYGWMVQPQAGNITLVGGPGKEFWVEDPLHPGTGTNWNQCMQGQCAANTEGLGPVTDMINPVSTQAPHDPGSWRIEEKPATANTQDFFLNVMLATNVTDTNVPQNVSVPAGLAAGMVGATWTDSTGTYTITLPQTGVGGHIKMTGLSVDEDLMSQAQQLPDQMQLVSGSPQTVAANAMASAPLVVAALDSAGNPVPNAVVHYGIIAGAGLLSSMTATTDGTGKASVNFTMGAGVAGSVTKVMADINGLQPVEFDFNMSGGGSTPALSSVSCAPASLSSGGVATCSVSLTQAAAGAAVTVTLSDNSQMLAVPVSVVVPISASSATFSATVGSVTSPQNAIVTASFGGVSKTTSINLGTSTPGGVAIPAGSWVMAQTHGAPVQTVGYEALVYAPSPVKKAVMLGNYHELGSEPNQSLNAYDFETNRWSVLNIGGSFHTEAMPEAGHPVGSISYDPNEKAFVYYCCGSGSNQPENVYYTWWFDPIGQAGRNKQTSPKPGPLLQEGSAFDPVNGVYVVQGNGTWTYNPVTNTYHQQTPAGTAPNINVNLPAMAFNSSNHKVYLFGGQVGSGFSNDLFTYDVAANTWTKLTPGGSLPAPRWRHAFAYDSTNNVFLLFGGQDASTIYNDSWIYNPASNAWTQLSPAQSPPIGAVGPFDKLAYDSDHNTFILVLSGTNGYADGVWGGYAAQTWFFRYQGAGPNAGATSSNPQPTAGAVNQNLDAWAKEPSLAASGSTLYAAWVETGRPFDSSNNTWFHVYGQQFTAGKWSALGGLPVSIDSEFSGNSESHSSAISMIAGKPWISWYKWNNTGNPGTLWSIWAKSWNGSTWQGGAIGLGGTGTIKVYQGRSQMTDVGGVPYIAFLEVDKNPVPQKTYVYVKYWNGTQWVLKGSGPLNISSGNTTAGSVSIASDGTNPYVAWTEYTSDGASQNQTPAQVYVAHWSGSAWVAVGGSLNKSASSWADDATIAYLGQPYVAWTERTTAGNNQVYVKTLSGSSWVQVGSGSLNQNTSTGWAYRPALAADASGGALYLGWVEQQALGQRPQTYVSKYASGAWTPLGGSLNADPVLGSSEHVSLTVVGGQPAAAWGEVSYGSLRQVYVKQWNGSAWTLNKGNATTPTQTPPPPPPPPSSSTTCDLNGDGVVNVLDVQMAVLQALGTSVCGSADLQSNGVCNVTDVQRIITAALGGSCVAGP